jgi:hypothetical protein
MPRVTWTGDASSAERANAAVANGVKKVGTEAAKTVKETERLNREAIRIKEAIDPQEKLNRKYMELGQHVKAGRLSIEQATAAGVKYRREMLGVSEASKDAFGTGLTSLLSGAAAGLLSVSKVVGVVTESFEKMAQASRKAVDDAFAALNVAGELQLLSSSPEDFATRTAESRSLIARGIVRPGEQAKAFETVSNLTQAGFDESERETLYRAAERKQVTDIVGLGGKLRSAQDIFSEADTGTISQTLYKVAQASQVLLEGTSETAAEIPNFASEARALGVDFETSLAAYTAIRKQSSTREIAGTRERALFDQLESQDLWKGDLPKSIADIRKRVESGEKLKSILPNIRARAGYRALATPEGQAIFAEQLPLIRASEGLTEQKQFLAADPRLSALHLKEQEEGKLATTSSSLFEEQQALLDTLHAREEMKRLQEVNEIGGLASGALRLLPSLFDALTPNEPKAELQLALPGLEQGDPLRNQIVDFLKRSAEASEKTQRTQQSKTATRAE